MNKRSLFISNFKGSNPWLKFVIKIFILLFILFVGCFEVIMPQYLYGFNASILDKVERAKSTDGPRILLIGNSNLVFGIDSEKIEQETGIPVVNMGLHAGLGNAFLENMARYYAREGDYVIICHTQYGDDDNSWNEELAWITIENHFELWRLIRLKDLWRMIKAYPTYLHDCVELMISGEGNRKTGEAYTREFFNIYGDNIFPRTEQQMEFKEGMLVVPEISSVCTDRLNRLYAELQNKGVHMAVASYPIVSCEYTPPESEYIAFQKELEEKLDCRVISDFTDYLIDEKYFFDSAYHLNDEGVQIRTRQLIEDIKNWLEVMEEDK